MPRLANLPPNVNPAMRHFFKKRQPSCLTDTNGTHYSRNASQGFLTGHTHSFDIFNDEAHTPSPQGSAKSAPSSRSEQSSQDVIPSTPARVDSTMMGVYPRPDDSPLSCGDTASLDLLVESGGVGDVEEEEEDEEVAHIEIGSGADSSKSGGRASEGSVVGVEGEVEVNMATPVRHGQKRVFEAALCAANSPLAKSPFHLTPKRRRRSLSE